MVNMYTEPEHRRQGLDVVCAAIARLDDLPQLDASVELSGAPDGDLTIASDASGLAQLSRLLLRCAQDTPEAREYRSCGPASTERRALTAIGSDVSLTAVELLQERPPHTERRKRVPDRLALLACSIFVFGIGFIFLMGVGVVTGVILEATLRPLLGPGCCRVHEAVTPPNRAMNLPWEPR